MQTQTKLQSSVYINPLEQKYSSDKTGHLDMRKSIKCRVVMDRRSRRAQESLQNRDCTFGPIVSQSGPKWDKSGTFSDHYTEI